MFSVLKRTISSRWFFDYLQHIWTLTSENLSSGVANNKAADQPAHPVFNLGLQQRGPTGPIQPKIGGHLEKEGALT